MNSSYTQKTNTLKDLIMVLMKGLSWTIRLVLPVITVSCLSAGLTFSFIVTNNPDKKMPPLSVLLTTHIHGPHQISFIIYGCQLMDVVVQHSA